MFTSSLVVGAATPDITLSFSRDLGRSLSESYDVQCEAKKCSLASYKGALLQQMADVPRKRVTAWIDAFEAAVKPTPKPTPSEDLRLLTVRFTKQPETTKVAYLELGEPKRKPPAAVVSAFVALESALQNASAATP